MSKHELAKQALHRLREESLAMSINPDEAVEALLTWCIEDMKTLRGPDHARSYVEYELSCIGSGGVFEIQKR